jgi:flagellar hook-associated protein 2
LVDKITQFVNDYNELLDSITSKTTEEFDRNYQPLTDAEKETLTDSEIDSLTKKAKTGLLRNDIYLTGIATSLRSTLYKAVQKTDGTGENIDYILADIGITTSSYTENGKLKIDEDRPVQRCGWCLEPFYPEIYSCLFRIQYHGETEAALR